MRFSMSFVCCRARNMVLSEMNRTLTELSSVLSHVKVSILSNVCCC
jgi:hypothetical protein